MTHDIPIPAPLAAGASLAGHPVNNWINDLVDQVRLLLVQANAQAAKLPEDLASCQDASGEMDVVGQRWLLPLGQSSASVRIATVKGPRYEIMTVMAYPDLLAQIPLFAAEIVVLQGSIRLAFIDWPRRLLASENRAAWDTAWRETMEPFCRWHAREPAPDWATPLSTGDYLYYYAVPREPQAVDPYLQAFATAWAAWVKHAQRYEASNQSFDENDDLSRQAKLDDFKRLHVAGSPGFPFLAKRFGENWAERFVHGFMYGT